MEISPTSRRGRVENGRAFEFRQEIVTVLSVLLIRRTYMYIFFLRNPRQGEWLMWHLFPGGILPGTNLFRKRPPGIIFIFKKLKTWLTVLKHPMVVSTFKRIYKYFNRDVGWAWKKFSFKIAKCVYILVFLYFYRRFSKMRLRYMLVFSICS